MLNTKIENPRFVGHNKKRRHIFISGGGVIEVQGDAIALSLAEKFLKDTEIHPSIGAGAHHMFN